MLTLQGQDSSTWWTDACSRSAAITAAGPIQNQLDERVDGRWRRHRGSFREKIAAHEAGHALAAVLLGMKIDYATIEPTERTWGHVVFAGASTEAERMATVNTVPVISETRQAIRQFLEGIRASEPQTSFREARRKVSRFLADTESLLLKHQRAINAIADELIRRRRLSGPEIERLVGAI